MNNNEPVEESLSIYLTEMGIGHKERELILNRFDAKDARIKELFDKNEKHYDSYVECTYKKSFLKQENEALKNQLETEMNINNSLAGDVEQLQQRNKELENGIKNIEEICGTISHSSYNQIREAINGTMEIVESLLSQTNDSQ